MKNDQTNKSQRDLRALLTLGLQVAEDEARSMPTTPEMRRAAQRLAAFTHDDLATRLRAERARAPSNIRSGAIRPSILAMSIERVRERLAELCGLHPEFGFAHRELAELSETDLRAMLEDVEALDERLS